MTDSYPSSAEQMTKTLRGVFFTLIGTALFAASHQYLLNNLRQTLALLAGTGMLTGAFVVALRGHVAHSKLLIILCFIGVSTYLCLIGYGTHDAAFLLYPVIVMAAALLLKRTQFLVAAALTIAIATALGVAELNGLVVHEAASLTGSEDLVGIFLILGIGSVIAYFLASELQQSLDRVSHQQQELSVKHGTLVDQADLLAASELRWRSLVENVPGAIMTVLPDGAVSLVEGQDRSRFEEVVGRPLTSVVDLESRPVVEACLARTNELLAPSSCLAMVSSTGLRRWYEFHFGPIISQRAVQAITVVIVDVTDRLRAEHEVRDLNAELEMRVEQRTRELAAATVEMEAFTYTVSHDLRAPLRHVLGYLGMLKRDAGERLGEEPARHVQTIERSARRMGVLIDELLAFSRVSRTEIRRSPVDTARMVEEVIEELSPDLSDRRIEWKVERLPIVNADAHLLRQVFVNLLSNAAKFTRDRPIAQIRVDALPLTSGSRTFRVADNGAGFDMRYVDKLFGVFQRLHTGEEFEGTGIGLAIVRRIIQRHGGMTSAEGEVGRGATFSFSLPEHE